MNKLENLLNAVTDSIREFNATIKVADDKKRFIIVVDNSEAQRLGTAIEEQFVESLRFENAFKMLEKTTLVFGF